MCAGGIAARGRRPASANPAVVLYEENDPEGQACEVKRVTFIYNTIRVQGHVPDDSICCQSAFPEVGRSGWFQPFRDRGGYHKSTASQNGALVIPSDPLTVAFRKQILDLAFSYKLPVVSAVRSFADEEGLLAYGVHIPNLFRQAAG